MAQSEAFIPSQYTSLYDAHRPTRAAYDVLPTAGASIFVGNSLAMEIGGLTDPVRQHPVKHERAGIRHGDPREAFVFAFYLWRATQSRLARLRFSVNA